MLIYFFCLFTVYSTVPTQKMLQWKLIKINDRRILFRQEFFNYCYVFKVVGG